METRSDLGLLEDGADLLGDLSAVSGVNLDEVSTESVLDVLAALGKWARNVVDNINTVLLGEHLVEQHAWLLVVVVWMLVWVSANVSGNWVGRPGVGLVLNWHVGGAVWLVVHWELVIVALNGHWAITLVVGAHAGTVWAVNWNLLIVWSKSVTMSVWIVQKTSLQHLVH